MCVGGGGGGLLTLIRDSRSPIKAGLRIKVHALFGPKEGNPTRAHNLALKFSGVMVIQQYMNGSSSSQVSWYGHISFLGDPVPSPFLDHQFSLAMCVASPCF